MKIFEWALGNLVDDKEVYICEIIKYVEHTNPPFIKY